MSPEGLESRTLLAAVAFSSENIFTVDSQQESALHTADMDGDGDLDLVTALRVDGVTRIAWYAQERGVDDFGPPRQFGADVYPVSIVDVDGDGDLDIVSSSSNRSSPSLGWMENLDGRGTLADPQPILSGAEGGLFVDFDHDGDIDLLRATDDGSSAAISLHSFTMISLYENVDGRTFQHAGELAGDIEGSILSLDAVDMDGDGDLDVTFTNYSPHNNERITWLENTRLGDEHMLLAAPNALIASVADLDGDGDLDLLAEDDRQKVMLYENVDGDFALDKVSEVDGESLLAVVDLDNDGDMDLLTHDAGRIIWRDIAVEDMGLILRQDFAIPGSARIVDLDQDGRVDLLSVDGDQVILYRNRLPGDSNGDGVFDSSDLAVAFEAGGFEDGVPDNSSWQHGDWNGDGEFDTSDLVFAFQHSRFAATAMTVSEALARDPQAADNTVPKLSQQHSALAFASHGIAQPASPPGHCSQRWMRVADLDGDHDEDIVIYDSSSLTWRENVDGVFGNPSVVVLDSIRDAVLKDIDGDDRVDIMIASSGRGLVRYEHKPGGAFSSEVIAGGPTYRAVASADLDGDGDPDLMADTNVGSVWFENDDSSRFASPVGFADSVWGQFVDLDDDGDADVLRGLGWHENLDGHGTFSSARTIGRASSFGLISLPADIDGDGDVDIAKASYLEDVSWFENTAFGLEHEIELEYENYSGLYAGDLDGDGDVDLVATRYQDSRSESIGWYENADGQGTFHAFKKLMSVDTVMSLSISDIDSDGRADLVVAECDAIAWYEQRLLADANDNGRFDSDDLTKVFAAGKYEDDVPDNATFDEGDWNGDGDFTTTDIVFVMQAGLYDPDAEP